MQFLNGITLLLVYQLVGEITVRLFGLPIPGPVLGMVLLFLTLVIRKRSGGALDTAANGLLSHLSLLFVPAGVGMMVYFSRILDEWLPIALSLVLGTAITMIVTAGAMLATQRLLARRPRRDG
ncbi:CidA/LrgA family protein [Marinobacter halodurans]|uniref:CidA/LrgA family protein n=1 Tax=Marinobacter halodurans TaxID=2528979 RepID=A0ABY1ZEU0_9GAMM|nr:CidA/LrgA family protein [Marinobacter halodurans]TBW48841.1 CidA/LrgA family protein [Marinobacter halodurans]